MRHCSLKYGCAISPIKRYGSAPATVAAATPLAVTARIVNNQRVIELSLYPGVVIHETPVAAKGSAATTQKKAPVADRGVRERWTQLNTGSPFLSVPTRP